MRGRIASAIIGAGIGAVLMGAAGASATGTPAHRYDVTVRDRGTFTEDEAANVRLVQFERLEDGTVRVIYRTSGGF
jgi:hypothetical protein